MSLFHRGLMASHSKGQITDMSELRYTSTASRYVQCGVHSDLAVHLRRFARAKASELVATRPGASKDVVLKELLEELRGKRQVHNRSVEYLYFVAMAFRYGFRADSLETLYKMIDHLHKRLSILMHGKSRAEQREGYWNACGDIFERLGSHMDCTDASGNKGWSMSLRTFVCTLDLLALLKGAPFEPCQIMRLADRVTDELDLKALASVLMVRPERIDDFVELLGTDQALLTKAALEELAEEPRILDALGIDALRVLLEVAGSDPDTTLLEAARMFYDSLKDVNDAHAERIKALVQTKDEKEQGPSNIVKVSFKDLILPKGLFRRQYELAVRIALWHGFLKPWGKRDHYTGSWVTNEAIWRECEAACRPHKITKGHFNEALGQLKQIGAVERKKQRTRLVHNPGNTKAKPLIELLKKLDKGILRRV